MKKLKITFGIIAIGIFSMLLINSCTTQRATVAAKSGAQLWGENCIRCHNIPSPSDYNDVDWETISLHMQVRANLTEEEMTKMKDFLKSAN